jgi:hypothetical protein
MSLDQLHYDVISDHFDVYFKTIHRQSASVCVWKRSHYTAVEQVIRKTVRVHQAHDGTVKQND